MNHDESVRNIIQIGARLHAKNMIAAADGNISVRQPNNDILITPSQAHKGYLHPASIAVIRLDGSTVSGNPSSERLMHLEIYRKVPSARCVVHAHPPTAIAWSVSHPKLTELPSTALSEVILAAGRIPIVPYARPGTEQMGTAISAFLPHSKILILARHGAVSWGESTDEAYWGMERLEHSAMILKAAHELGGISPLPPDEVEFLRHLRSLLGNRNL